jgi:hypothetical protein
MMFYKKGVPLCGVDNSAVKTVGRKIQASLDGLDVITDVYFTSRKANSAGSIDPGDPHKDFSSFGCVSVTSQPDANGGFTMWQATFQGFLTWPKKPTGGMSTGLGEQPVATHPNYKESTAWGKVFGEGEGNPNAYGRVERQGMFQHFGPLPNGKDGAVNPADVEGADKLQGVTSYLAAAQPTYRYSRLTMNRWAPLGAIGQAFGAISSALIPPGKPADIGETNWLLTSIDEQAQELSDTTVAWTTTLEFTLSIGGKWNPLLYEDSGYDDYNLDSESEVDSKPK